MSGFATRFGRCLVLGGAWTVLGFLVLPMIIVFPVSLTDQYYLSLPRETLSLRHYAALVGKPIWISAGLQSLVVAVASTAAAVVLGALCAIGCWRLATRLSETARAFMLLPIIVPAIVQGMAMYRFWIDLGLIDTYLGTILAHTIVGLPYVVITVSASLANFDVRQEQAARGLGASMGQTIRWVIVPGIMPGLLSGALFAFTHSFDEIVLVLFLTSRKIYTLPKRIWDGIEDHVDPTIAAVATLLIATTFLLLLADLLYRRHRARRAASP
ncbi:MAG: ABC transporter permease [Alphaproteobacteria bacterium]|nr:ABC transporter permease [Alphaproteobacteria bacterium]